MTTRSLLILLATATVSLVAVAAPEGEKLDSGLGALPAYAQWQDKSGREPMVLRSAPRVAALGATRVAGESLDDGLGELPPYTQWLDKSGRDPMGRHAQQLAAR